MNQIRSIQALNKRELESCVSPNASWHADYRHTAFVYVGGLPFQLNEGDIVTIFSQYGEPNYIKLARDKETGKSRGFGWLKYEDQRSCDLAVDNLGGVEVMGRILRVDHAEYRRKDGDEDDGGIDLLDGEESDETEQELHHDGGKYEQKRVKHPGADQTKRPVLKEELELEALLQNHDDDDDPMKEYMIQEKRQAAEVAVKWWEKEIRGRRRAGKEEDKSRRHRHHHRSKRHEANFEKRRARGSISPPSGPENHRKRPRRHSVSSRDRSLSPGRRRAIT